MSKKFNFRVTHKYKKSRVGELSMARGKIQTPAFMPVGTAATVKAMLPENISATGAEILLCNTYHLMLRPGSERIAELGGLHKFMNWPKPILTDSGGFQVMSLSKLSEINEKGVSFRSHIDGSRYELTRVRSIELQKELGSDIVMCFDECTKFPTTKNEAAKSMNLSMRWAKRSKDKFANQNGQALFGIVQGSTYRGLREESSEILKKIGFDGYAIGGLAVGEGQVEMLKVLDYAPSFLPEKAPKYFSDGSFRIQMAQCFVINKND